MNFHSIVNRISPGEKIRIVTLGGRSTFTLSRAGNNLVVTNSKGNSKVINAAYWEEVVNRRSRLGSIRNQTIQYNHPNWIDAPDLIFPPYVAAAIKHFGG